MGAVGVDPHEPPKDPCPATITYTQFRISAERPVLAKQVGIKHGHRHFQPCPSTRAACEMRT